MSFVCSEYVSKDHVSSGFGACVVHRKCLPKDIRFKVIYMIWASELRSSDSSFLFSIEGTEMHYWKDNIKVLRKFRLWTFSFEAYEKST